MKRLVIILAILMGCIALGGYTCATVNSFNDQIQAEITMLLHTKDSPAKSEVFHVTSQCITFAERYAMLLDNHLLSTLHFQAEAANFAAESQDKNETREALFLLSEALNNLTDGEQVHLHTLLTAIPIK